MDTITDHIADNVQPVDLLAEWLRLGREVLSRYYPDAKYAVLVIAHASGLPDAAIPVFCTRDG